MAAKKSQRTPATLDSLQRLIARTAVSTDKKFRALADDISGVKGQIADLKTEMMEQFDHVDKQFGAVDGRLRDISSEIAVIHRRIERLEEQGASNAASQRRSTTCLRASRRSKSTSASTRKSPLSYRWQSRPSKAFIERRLITPLPIAVFRHVKALGARHI